ncbi:hypothetical protein KWH02_20520, partial [Xanthomonas campestris pv. uppalii]|uniref:hypothetical protein n=1 Tax=Xanthomonas euvesicatoria TaxID=456327 RepID=UPI001C471936
MQPVKTDDTITKTRSLAVLLKIAPFGKPLDFKAQSINELWAVGCTEDLLYELDKEGAIIFEFCSDDVLVCYTKEETGSTPISRTVVKELQPSDPAWPPFAA